MDSDQEGEALGLEVTLAERVNFACQQNDVPLLRDLVLQNRGGDQLNGLTLEISSDPAFLKARTWHVDRLGAGDTLHIDDRRVSLDPGVLWQLSEAITATVHIRVTDGDTVLQSVDQSVELLARNEWGGASYMPEMIAAFVTPNDPAIDRLLKDASQALGKAGLNTSLDGYQTESPQRAAHIVAAIWSSVCGVGLSYATPPASFERSGQKVRTPSHIVEGGLATCLDLTLLFASCLEQAGLHPIIVFTRGHSFVGCWLQDEQFSSVTVDDVTSLRKRIQLKEALFFETTFVTQEPRPKFKFAMKHAGEALAEENDEQFELAIDVHRARMQRIRPIPTGREPEPKASEPVADAASEPAVELEGLDQIPSDATTVEQEVAESPKSRLDRWQRKLLDLSLRNRLLNFKPSKRAIAIQCPDPGQLEDRLADGMKIQVMPSPRMMDEESGRSADLYRRQHGEDADEGYALDALRRNEVIVDLPPDELDRRLVELYRAARAALQEGGANTLFLAFGFLVWTKGDGKSDRRYRAPLILVPVQLERRSVRSGMKLVLHDDEARVNPTLLQMLEQDFALRVPELLGPIPTDEHGLDVQGIWNAMTRAIRDQEGWEVTEDVVLSTFSFSKYLMWKDLVDRTDVLKDNAVVRHLIDTPKEVYRSEVTFPDPRRLDYDYPPEQTFTPLPADSSQLSAVMAAAAGKDFVLEGPPGTGKSQTISNMIAQCLAEGRTVLFVSEKTAALDVVYRRLRDVGLGEFCLELHSSKARKLDVLEQLRSAWDSQADLDAEQWEREAKRLASLRQELNAFVTHLHHRYPNALTPHYAIGKVIGGRDVPRVNVGWNSPETHDADALQELRDIAERIDINSAELGSVAESAFTGVAEPDWSPSWQHDLIDAAKRAMPVLRTFADHARALEESCGLPSAPLTRDRLRSLSSLAKVLPWAYGRNYAFALEPQGPQTISELKQGLELLEQRRSTLAQLSVEYRPDALSDLPIGELNELWAEAESTWWPRKAILRRRVRKTLRNAVHARRKPNADVDLPQLSEIRRLDSELDKYDYLKAGTAGLWDGLGTDAEKVRAAVDITGRIRAAIGSLAQAPDTLIDTQAAVRRLLSDGNALLSEEATVGRAAKSYRESDQALNERLETLTALTRNPAEHLLAGDVQDWPEALEKKLGRWIQEENRLRTWCAWRRVRDEAMGRGLSPLVEAVENGSIETGRVREAFEVNYCRWWIDAVVDGDEVLRGFVPAEHERRIAEFARLDDEFTKLTRSYIRAKLCGFLPAKDEVKRSSEWGVLKRELEKKRRHKPLRQLVEEMPTALTKLTPCLLMSPLSIAQYLSPEQAQFDVVIFDEASQIPVWDAVGAIARGRQAVIVGDPKQLPPTSFFERTEDEDYEDEDVERDLESILDECMGANVPLERLNWHYRSRHESLIAFSNQRYYGGGLVTFPAPVTEDRAVSYHHVPDGEYQKGGARTNPEEAKALVADIIGRIKDPEFANAGLSIGVVTFNTEQQRLIEDLFDSERRNDPSIEPWFDDDALEPIMVKNLESVQGDERDIIYFSVTYGPDQHGRVSMNFGPLNRDGGERRLNVAITRARHALRVFAALKAEQINLARTQAVGVRDFKHFLEFAERGPRALAEATYAGTADFDSPFEQAVASALTERGWQIHPQVGVSGFRVDLGVVHPDAPGVYLAGVECDGATYHRAATARDRDKLREGVLRGLGWEILRVWSTDWWVDSPGAMDKLDGRLNELLEASRAARAASQDSTQAVRAAQDEVADIDDGGAGSAQVIAPPASAPANDSPSVDMEETQVAERYARAPAAHEGESLSTARGEAGDSKVTTYRQCALGTYLGIIDPDQFYESSYTPVLSKLVAVVVAEEGPIRDELLVRRIARAHGFQRAGQRIRKRVLSIARQKAVTTEEDVGTFYWPEGLSEPWRWFRAPDVGDARSVEDIPMEELVVLSSHLSQQGHSGENLLREMAAACGVKRVSKAIRERLADATGQSASP
ncbi:DUF3320 domain-containing protein [Ectothiorhodospiraceae bacterium WFHF3C12]|nr:DUF3320 domain-containing protein [Ectothiorhodospiraceae bacterium WFHF3C12]